jgi:hypothetical protein
MTETLTLMKLSSLRLLSCLLTSSAKFWPD